MTRSPFKLERPLHYILDAKGNPRAAGITAYVRWCKKANTQASRIVKQDQIGDVFVSTVFLGIDASLDWLGHSPPLLWETLPFDKDGPRLDEMQRYYTRAAALAGHEEMCARVRRGRQ